MKLKLLLTVLTGLICYGVVQAQPSYLAPVFSQRVEPSAGVRRKAYEERINEVLVWSAHRTSADKLGNPDLASIAARLALGQDAQYCSKQLIDLMSKQDPGQKGTGPFWMFPVVEIAFLGRDLLSAEAKQSIRNAWHTNIQLRGDTENHWAMYHASLYLMSELYPNDPAESWYNGKSSQENLAESREYLLSWMDLTTSIGQGEFNVPNYIAEYAIPMAMLASWAKDPLIKKRGQMMLDWLYADLAQNTLLGIIHGPAARSDDMVVIEPSLAMASNFSWLMFGNAPPTKGYGGWLGMYACMAINYDVPEVIYKIAVDRKGDFLQEDLKRTRRRWRNSDVLTAPVYKTNYTRLDYAVGSYQGGLVDPIQTHGWDVTWAVPNPKGIHNMMFSMNPISSTDDLETCFTVLPDEMPQRVMLEGKPSYDFPGKLLGGSRFEQVYQNLDTIIALYNIPEGTRFPHINGFFSKDLSDFVVDSSGWIFAQGGNAYLAYKPLAGYTLEPISLEKSWLPGLPINLGDKRLYSPHLKNGTIIQVGSAKEFKDFDAFKQRIRELPLRVTLEPVPTVDMTTLRGNQIKCVFGKPPYLNAKPVDYSRWKLFEGPYLNAEKNSHVLTITYGNLKRVLDFNTVTITDN